MKKRIRPYDLTPISGHAIADVTLKFLTNFVRFKRINELYRTHRHKAAIEFVDAILKELNLSAYVDSRDLRNIPTEGSFIVVSNFPLGGVDAFLLYSVISQKRPDVKLIISRKYYEIEPVNEISLPLPDSKASFSTITYLKRIYSHLNAGGGIIVFPALNPAKYNPTKNVVVDPQWDVDIIRLIKISKVPVIPVFINNQNSFIFHILGIVHPVFQALRLEREVGKKTNSQIPIRIGRPISPETLEKYDSQTASRFLRSKTFALGAGLELSAFDFLHKPHVQATTEPEPIAEPIDPKLIEKEIENAKEEYLQFSVNEMDVLVAPTYVIPDVITELGRLREITFRRLDEGSGKSLDLDEFDLYYHHLIIWDNKNKKIVGAYRIGRGDEILDRFGVSGFYTSTLFKFKKDFLPIMRRGLELGRSFIVPEYQRKPLSLFLLWKGILYFLLKNSEYQYLIGPVTMSVKFSELSKTLIVRFFEKYYSNPEMTRLVKPRMPYKSKIKSVDVDILLKEVGNNINKLDNIIKEIENGLRLPVLYKKYISLGAKVLTFNVDPDFNYCVDGLMVLDLYDMPLDVVRSMAKELNEQQLLDRFLTE